MSAYIVKIGQPLRGGGEQQSTTLMCQSISGRFSWGSSPGSAELVYAGTGTTVATGARVDFSIGNHLFAGVCKSDTLVQSSNGTLRTLEFQDMRHYLAWDTVFAVFNMPDVRLVNGIRLKRYWHILPSDWRLQRRIYSSAPMMGWRMLAHIFNAPTVFTRWSWDLTSNGLFPSGLLNWPIYEVDANGGLRLDALLNLICERSGLVFTHDPRPACDNRLVFTRKGFGLLPIPFPSNSDDRRSGYSLTENPMNVCVLGDRNRYQLLNVPMVKDWAGAWEEFLDVELLVRDLFEHECGINPGTGTIEPFKSFTNDPDQWFGYGAAKARALEITVGEYAALREARVMGGGAAFVDTRKYAGRWRMDMPAALYIQRILFRAFRPGITGFVNIDGVSVSLDSAPIADQMLSRVYLDYATGAMTTDVLQPVDGNGVLAVKGYQVGEDLFRLAQPDRINVDFFSADSRGWSVVPFQADDSGEGMRFVLCDEPVFVSDNLFTIVNGYAVLNAAAVLQTPLVKAALVFEGERYTYWKGSGICKGRYNPGQPIPGRTRVESVPSLMIEAVSDGRTVMEIPYSNAQTADQKADLIASTLLLQQWNYLSGGYNLKWNPKLCPPTEFGTPLAPSDSSCIDRIEIRAGPGGVMEVVDFTAERSRDSFEPERELDRRTLQASLLPGQAELRQQAADQKRFNAALRQTGNPKLISKLLRGEIDEALAYVRFVPGASLPATLPAGTPLVMAAGTTRVIAPGSVTAAATNIFAGVTVRENEPTDFTLAVQRSGDTLARVKGPVAVNDAIGLSGSGTDFATNGAYLKKGGTPSAGVALQAITGSGVQLIKVRLGGGGGPTGTLNFKGEYVWSSRIAAGDIYIVSSGANAGTYICIASAPTQTNPPWTGGPGWVRLPTNDSRVGTWV